MSSVPPVTAAAGDANRVAVEYDPFAQGAVARVVPTTEPQREIWLADQLGRDASLAFNESVSLRLRGPLDERALSAALQGLLDRHAALRANLGPEGDTLCVLDHVALDMPLLDYSGMTPADADAQVRARQRTAVETPFDLQHDRLFRAELLRLSAQDHVLVLTAHHVVCDGWSWWVIVRELATLYAKASGAQHTPLPDADDFASYALQQAAAPPVEADEHYWLQRFSGELPVLDLPTDRPRPARRGFASQREDVVLDASLVASLRKLGARRGASLFATLLGTFAALIARLSAQSQVVIGIPAAGQAVDGHDRLVGHCVNALPLLFEPDPAQPAAKAIDDAQATLLDAIEHQRYTFGTLLRKIRVERDPARVPLISVMFNIDQAMDQEHAAFPGLQLDFASNPRAFENFELFVNAVQEHGGLRLECQYNTGLFDAATIRRWMGHWRTFLQALVDDADGDIALGELPLLSDLERRQVLDKWNATAAPVADACVHELFEAQVARTPDAPALEFQGERLSYAALNAQANRLARRLREAGVRADDRVAICATRGLEMVIGLFAVLKAGGAYVPIDPAYPEDRLAFLLEDSAPRVILLQAGLSEAASAAIAASGHPVLPLTLDRAAASSSDDDANLDRAGAGLSSDSLAYVIYTSGSTGKPKGVLLTHAGVNNYLQWATRTYAPTRGSAMSSSFAFDATVTSLFTPLLCGGLVRIVPEKQEVDGLLDVLADPAGCALVKITPAHLDALGRRLQASGGASHADIFVVGGEALPAATVALWRTLQPTVRIVNEYGPTETVVGCCIEELVPGAEVHDPVPIGRPIDNMRLYLLDAFRQPVPVGVTGEIYIGGVSVARGYLARPELTAERFLPDPFSPTPGARMYRSGDLGRWLSDGRIEYLGRNDFQVKVRGYRVEPGEIERTLAAHDSVEQAVVLVREDRKGDARLVAYAVPRAGREIDPDALAAHLKKTLPDYMVPQHIAPLAQIPLTTNGKIDRKALPVPDVSARRDAQRVAPRDALESSVADAMSQVLGVPELGIHDDFFALGGHSLLAAQLTTRLNRDLGVQLSLRSVFDAPTAERLAALVRESAPAATRKPIERRADQRTAPLSLMQERCRLFEEYNPGNLSYNGPSGHRLTGPLEPTLLDRAFRLLAQRQTVLRTGIALRDGEPTQIVHDDIDPGLTQVEDLCALPTDEREVELARRMRALVETPFSDLSRAPLFVARLFRMAPEEHVLFFMPHHIVWDGWSFDLLYADLSQIYAALADGREPAMPELPVTYGDFAAWHRDWLQGDEYAGQVTFWRERLGRAGSDGERLQALPTDMPRRRGMSGKSSSHKIVIDGALTGALQAASRRVDVTLFVTLLSAYVLVLARMAGSRDIVVGTPVRGRNTAEVEGLMGYFTNLLPLRLAIDPTQSFHDFSREVRAVVLDSFAHPDIRLEDLSRELSLRSEGGGSMLYHALFSFQDVRQRVTRWGPLAHERVEVFQPGATEDLGLWFVEEAGGLTGGLIYNAEILHDSTTARLRDRYLAVLAAIARDPSATIDVLGTFDDGAPDLIGAEAAQADTDDTLAKDTMASERSDTRVDYLTKLWTDLLETPVAPSDNFFDIGGNSMLAVQMAERVARDTGVRLKLMRIAVQTLGDIAAELPESPAATAPATGKGGMLGGLKRLFGG